MAVNFDKIKRINEKVNDLIFGYFREHHDKYFDVDNNPYYSLQPLLVYVCISFYCFRHEWNTEMLGDDIEIGDDNIVTKTAQKNSNILIKGEISSGKHEYEFKIIECKNALKTSYGEAEWFDIVIGITGSNILNESLDSYLRIGSVLGNGYYYSASYQRFRTQDQGSVVISNKMPCKKGSIIKLKIDLDELKMEYFIDATLVGCITDIPSASYVVGMYLFCNETKIQLL